MIRGRLDALVIDGESVTIVDYKTDNVTAERMAERAEAYRGQLQTYAWAMERITRKKVRAAFLAFLTPRMVWRLGFPDGPTGIMR